MYKIFITLLILIFALSAHAADVVEMMGNISVDRAYARAKPDAKSKALLRLGKNSKVVIVSKEGDWLKILLFNNRYAYIHSSVVHMKFSNVTKSESQSKVLIDVENILKQFNDAVQSSWYAEKQKIVPSVTYLNGKSPDNITILFSAVNSKGASVPSLKENPLQKDMVKLIELIFMKMIVLPYDRYTINIKTPDFVSGIYKGRTADYAVLTLQKNYANLNEIKNGTGSVWDYVRSVKKPEDLFKDYPH